MTPATTDNRKILIRKAHWSSGELKMSYTVGPIYLLLIDRVPLNRLLRILLQG